jgi:hypothetical protein
MTGAYKKIEAMKRGLGDDPAVAAALRLANESVQEGMSAGDKKKRLEMIKKAVEKLNAKNDAKAKADFLAAMKDMVDESLKKFNESFSNTQENLTSLEEKVITFGYTFFDTKSLNSFMKKALKLKGLTIIDSAKKAGGQFVVKVQGEKNVITQANALAIQAQSESVSVEVVTEAYSKNLTDKDVDAQFKSMRDPESFYGDLDTARADMKKDYSPKNSARPKVWTSLRYPVRNGDYYFAFIDKNQKNNMKYNEKMNDALQAALKGGDKKSVDDMWSVVSRELITYPKSLGWNDTMTREELYGAIQHMLGKISESNITEKSFKTKAGLMVGKRSKAPKYESTSVNENYRTLARKGMGAETKSSIKVGREVDYYDNNGNKRQGKIIKMDQVMSGGYTVKDDQTGKVYKFTYHNRMKAQKLLNQQVESMKEFKQRLDGLKEATFEFVDMNKKTRDIVVNLAKKHGVKVKERKKGNLSNLDLEAPNNKMGKFMENLPPEALS